MHDVFRSARRTGVRFVVAGSLGAAVLAGGASTGAIASNEPVGPHSDPTVILPCPMYGSDTRCCNDHDCRSSYPRYVTVSQDGAEDLASQNPGGYEPDPSAYDEGIPDPIDAANDDGDDAALAIRPALEQAGIDLAYATIIDENSAVISAAAGTGFTDCPYHYTCFWRHAHYRGRAYFSRAGSDGYLWHNLRDFGLSDEISSWRNRRGFVTVLARDIDGGGPPACLARYSHNAHMFYMNDKASSFRLTQYKFCGN
jgi:hypothetical protein